jgi:hypothetical protein
MRRGSGATIRGRLGYGLFCLLIAAGCIAASRLMTVRVVGTRDYFGNDWLPMTLVGVIAGIALPALGVLAWRLRKPNVSGLLSASYGLTFFAGFVYFEKVAISPATAPASGNPPSHELAELGYAALTMTGVVVFAVTALALMVVSVAGPRARQQSGAQ